MSNLKEALPEDVIEVRLSNVKVMDDPINNFLENIFRTNVHPTAKSSDEMCHYGFTLAIAPFRKVLVNGKNDKIVNFSEFEQDMFVTQIIEQYKPEGRVCEYEIEYTKAGVAHIHGFLNCSETEVYLMQESIHNAYGYKNQSPERVFMVKRTLQNLAYWKKYMRKTKK